MAEIKINILLESSFEKINKTCQGTKEDNQITYQDGLDQVSLKIINNDLILTKSNNDYKITINLQQKKSHGSYLDLKTGLELKLNVKQELLEIGEDYLTFQYIIEENKINCHLKYEVLE